MPETYAKYNGYRENYKKLLPLLKEGDPIENICRLGAEREGDGARIACLGRDFVLTREGVEDRSGLADDTNLRSVLIFYAVSQGAGEPMGDYAPLSRLTGMIEGRNALGADMMTTPLLREFGGDNGRFASAVARLGGQEQPMGSAGKHVWRMLVLPKIPMELVFYEADDEFPAEIQFLYDRSCPRFLEFECLAFLTGSVVKALIRCGKSLSDEGNADKSSSHPTQ